jgi:hypothetical protein
MDRVCQGPHVVFALLLAVLLGGTVNADGTPPQQPASEGIPIHLRAWTPSPFAEVALTSPELTACFMLSPGWWSTAARPAALPDETTLARALGAQLQGVLEPGVLPPLNVVVAATESANPEAVAHADTVLILQPRTEKPDAVEMARTLGPAILLAYSRPAPPDPRCDIPLLMIGEAIANAGSLTLAALPPELRPVRDWLEVRDASPALEALASEVLDPETHWQTRRARLLRMSQVGGSNPPLAAAAALVVEAFGNATAARAKPFDLLLAWMKSSGKGFPAMPLVLRRALKRPLEAGMPAEKNLSERNEVGWDMLLRRLQAGRVVLSEIPATAPLPLRMRAAAALRATGVQGLCAWLASAPLPQVRTGCRSEGEVGGVVATRPRAEGGFEVFWRSSAGEETPLLFWPKWALFPTIVPSSGELWFIDPDGVWHLPLDGHAAPRLASSGSFRHLAVAPDGGAVATARWPSGGAVVIRSSGTREIEVDARGGIAFIDADVLVANDGAQFTLASLEGQVRRDVFAIKCCRSLVVARGAVTAGVGAPCEPGLVRVALNERSAVSLLRLANGPLGLVALPGGAYLFGTAEGLWSWPGQGPPERIGGGLTPGPG